MNTCVCRLYKYKITNTTIDIKEISLTASLQFTRTWSRLLVISNASSVALSSSMFKVKIVIFCVSVAGLY